MGEGGGEHDSCSRSLRKPSERCRPATVNEFLRPNLGIGTCGSLLEESGCLLLDWWARQLDARFVGGGDKSAEAKPPRCLSVGSSGPVGRASPPSSSECCSARLWRAADRRTSGDWMDARCISLFQRPGWEPARVAFDAAQFPSTRFGGCQWESLEPNSRIHSRTADGLISGNGQFENHSPSK